jgi:hypothetical protein
MAYYDLSNVQDYLITKKGSSEGEKLALIQKMNTNALNSGHSQAAFNAQLQKAVDSGLIQANTVNSILHPESAASGSAGAADSTESSFFGNIAATLTSFFFGSNTNKKVDSSGTPAYHDESPLVKSEDVNNSGDVDNSH